MSTALAMNYSDHFDPLALGLVNRYATGAFAAVFGQQAARTVGSPSIRDVMSAVQSRGGIRGPVQATLTSDDFVKVISDLANAAGLVGYNMNFPAILAISHETRDIENFLPVERPRAGMFPALLAVSEGGEVTYGDVGERGESYAAVRYARLLEFTEQALINDRLGLLVEPNLRIGESVADLKASTIAGLIASNPLLSDGVPVFHADHNNVAVTPAAPDVDTLALATTAMRRQKHLDGARPIAVDPAFIVVPPELEKAALQVVAAITPQTVAEVNPFASRLTVIVEPRLVDPKAWYVFARPERQMSLEHGNVQDTADPEIRTEAPIGKHSIITRVTTDFAAGWLDFRGAYKNAGAGEGE